MVVLNSISKKRKLTAQRFNSLRRERSSDLISRYSRLVHKHGNLGITSAHDYRHVGSVASYAKRMAKYFGGTRAEQLAARDAGHLHDRIRLPTEELMDREKAIKGLGAFMPKNTSEKKISYLVDTALEHRRKMGGKVSDYEQKNSVDKISSDELTAVFLRDKLLKNKRMKSNEVDQIVSAIIAAGKMPDKLSWKKNLPHSALVFADKFFEANGAFVAFRRSYFMAERSDRRKELVNLMKQSQKNGMNKIDSFNEGVRQIVLDETNKQIKAYSNLETIPEVFHPFIKYQAEWQYSLKSALEKKEPWAMNLAVNLFSTGMKKLKSQVSLEEAIRKFKPISSTSPDSKFKKEAIDYLEGRLWNKFKQLVKA